MPASAIAAVVPDAEQHATIGGNALRAAVLGANDGLVSNLSLVMGVAGAGLASSTILITGVAGLLAGACSMAMGEWVSVTSSRELYQRELAVERAEIAGHPAAEHAELVDIYTHRGLDEQTARVLADHVMADPDRALDVMAREELGIDPDKLGGSAFTAAWSSFTLFVLGIVNTLTMSVLERTREIGVLRALGASRWRVRRAMADESLLISVAGTLAGIGAGLVVAVLWVVGMRETRYPGMSMHLPFGLLLTIAVLGVLMGVLAAIVPARRAAKLDPLAALRYE